MIERVRSDCLPALVGAVMLAETGHSRHNLAALQLKSRQL